MGVIASLELKPTHGQNDVAVRVSTDPGGPGAEQVLPVATAGWRR